MNEVCSYCQQPGHTVHEVLVNIMEGYKKTWNNHVPGQDCWCKPTLGKGFLVHRNYEWSGSNWKALKES